MLTDFGRVLTAMITPFDSAGNVDLDSAKEIAKMLANSGTDAIVVSGTTGEGPVLSVRDKINLFETVKEVVDGRALVLAGTGNYNTEESINLSKEAEAVGVDGVMLVVPYYNRPSQEGLYQHFKTIADKIDLPVLLYNVPSRTSRNMEPKTVKRLAEIENIIAIKEAAGDMDQVSELCRITPSNFLIYSGDDSMTLPMLAVGGHGIVSVASHLVGRKIKEMIEAFVAGKVEMARDIHLQLLPLFKAIFVNSNPVPIKAALELMGYSVGNVKLPLVPLTENELDYLSGVMREYSLIS